jgi:hypothetical protein
MTDLTEKHFEREYSDFLLKVANEICELVRSSETMTRFREQVRIFCEKNEEHHKEVEQLKKGSIADSKLQAELKNLEKKICGKKWNEKLNNIPLIADELYGTLPEGYENYVWIDGFCISPPKTADLWFYLIRSLNFYDLIINPTPRMTHEYHRWENEVTRASDDDKITSYYALLTAINDKELPEKPNISYKAYNGSWDLSDKWIQKLSWEYWPIYHPWGWKTRDWIIHALNDVRADLASLDKVKAMRPETLHDEIRIMEELAEEIERWAAESEFKGIKEEEQFQNDYVKKPYQENYYKFLTRQIKLISIIGKDELNQMIERLKWRKPEIGKALDEQRKEIHSKIDPIFQSSLNCSNDNLIIASILIDGYAEELAKSLLNIARIMRQESQIGGTDPDSTKQKNKQTISQIITQGEGHTVEFKETLEYSVRESKQDTNLNKECLKTIAAFLNTDGGTLLIGVRDNGEITGIERDLPYVQRKNEDGFQLKLRDLIKNNFTPFPSGRVDINFEKHSNETVCKVDVEPINKNQIIHLGKDVYIRDGNMIRKLEGRDLTDWIQQRGK